jgi:hypothetical protein
MVNSLAGPIFRAESTKRPAIKTVLNRDIIDGTEKETVKGRRIVWR